jgi:histidine triad (HIT) family protein
VGVNLRQNNGSKAGQDVFHFHLHVVPRYEGDTVLPGCVWGVPPWEPPPGGNEERRRIADTIRRGIASRSAGRGDPPTGFPSVSGCQASGWRQRRPANRL